MPANNLPENLTPAARGAQVNAILRQMRACGLLSPANIGLAIILVAIIPGLLDITALAMSVLSIIVFTLGLICAHIYGPLAYARIREKTGKRNKPSTTHAADAPQDPVAPAPTGVTYDHTPGSAD